MIGLRLESNSSEHVAQTAPGDLCRPLGSPAARDFRGNDSLDLRIGDRIDLCGGRRPPGTYIDAHQTPLPTQSLDYTLTHRHDGQLRGGCSVTRRTWARRRSAVRR